MNLKKTQVGSLYALLAAIFFGISMPFSKMLLEKTSPIMLSGLLYSGSAVGLIILAPLKRIFAKKSSGAAIAKKDLTKLAISIFFGGIMAPSFLMLGLSLIPAHNASILLNSEVILTAFIAWFIFKEKFDWHIMIGIILAIIANVLISSEELKLDNIPWGSILVVLACLCWAIDNNITSKIANNDVFALSIARGVIAGIFNILLALALGQKLTSINIFAASLAVGFLGYGTCLILFITALRNVGAAKAGAYFSMSPFCGAVFSLIILHEKPTTIFFVATSLMIASVIILSYKELFSQK